METAISQISNLPITKEQVKLFTDKLISEALSNPETALKLKLLIKTFASISETVKKNSEYDKYLIKIFKELLEEKYKDNPNEEKKFIEFFGQKIILTSKSTPDFESINDKELKDLEFKVKQRKEVLENGYDVSDVDEETGEIITKRISCDIKTTEYLKITELK